MGRILLGIATVSLYASAVMLAILLFRRVFRRTLSANLRYALWALFVLRLLLPVTIESGFHLPPAEVVSGWFSTPAQVAEAPVIAEAHEAPPTIMTQPVPRPEAGAAAAVARPAASQPAEPATRGINWEAVLFSVYVSGAVLMGILTLSARKKYLRAILSGRTPPGNIRSFCLEGCCDTLGCGRDVRLLVTKRGVSPALILYRWRPTLVLPASLSEYDDMRYAMLHELCHRRRLDHITLPLLALLRCVYWFNPLIHMGLKWMQTDMETACDASVLSHLPASEKRGYLSALLSLFTTTTPTAPLTAEFSAKRLAKQRMQGAFLPSRTRLPAAAAGTLLTLTLLVCCFTTACQSAPAESPTAPAAPRVESTPVQSGAPAISPYSSAIQVTDAAGKVRTFMLTDMGVSQESHSDPRGEIIDAREAAVRAAKRLIAVFGDAVPDCTLSIAFHNHDENELAAQQYQLYADGSDYGSAAFYCLIDAETGDVLNVENLFRDADRPDPGLTDFDWDSVDSAAVQKECMDAARTLIEKLFAEQGEILPDSYIDGMQGVSIDGYTIANDCYIHMSEGDCYLVRVFYPAPAVGSLQAYPLGWEACKEGTWYPEYLLPPRDDDAPTVSNGGYEVRQTEGSEMTDAEYEALAALALSRVGEGVFDHPGPLHPKTKPGKSSVSTYFIAACLETMGYRINGSSGTDIFSASDPALFTGCRLGFNYGDEENTFMGVYAGSGQYVYGSVESGKVELGDLEKDFPSFSAVRVITTEVYAPVRGFHSEADAAGALVAVETARGMLGQIVPLPEGAERGTEAASQAFVETVYGRTELASYDFVELWSMDDPALTPGKELTLYPIQTKVELKDMRHGIVLEGTTYASVDPETGKVSLFDLADDFNSGLYGTILCAAIVLDP